MVDPLTALGAAGSAINVAEFVGHVGTRLARFLKAIKTAGQSRDDLYYRVEALRDVVVATGRLLARRERQRQCGLSQKLSISDSDDDDEENLLGLLWTALHRIDSHVTRLEDAIAPFAKTSSTGFGRPSLAFLLERKSAGIERVVRMIAIHTQTLQVLQTGLIP